MNNWGTHVFFTLFIWAITTVCLSSDIPLPQGWRMPTATETKAEWRNKDPNRYLWISADFNGDGVLDEARLLIRDKPQGLGLFAFVSQKDATYKSFLLDEKNNPSRIIGLGIRKVPSGRYITACGYGIACAKNEAKEVHLPYEGIDYFKEGSANMYFYWDKAAKGFTHVWIND